MNKRLFVCLAFILLICSPSLAQPHLWAAHNTTINMDLGSEGGISADLSTARFFCLTLEAADDSNVPELDVNLNDRNTIPKFTVLGGNYSYWNGDGLKKVTGSSQQFDMARTDTVMYSNHSTLIASDNMGYVPTGDGGDWVHFFFEADNGLNGVNVTWEGPAAGMGTVPEFKTTKEQLEGIVPYIEYFYDDPDVMSTTRKLVGFNWRFVRSDDIATAVSADTDITIDIKYTGGTLEFWADLSNVKLGDGPMTIKAGEILEGTVDFSDVQNMDTSITLFRYYVGDEKEKLYQWRFINSGSMGVADPFIELASSYRINIPIVDGQPDYKYARYSHTELTITNWGVIFEPEYCEIGKLEIDGGSYKLADNNGVALNAEDFPYIPLVQMRMPGPGTFEPSYNPMMADNLRPLGWDYLNGRYWGRRIFMTDETGDSLSGKKISWTFTDEKVKGINGSSMLPDYKSVSEQLSETGFFPYVELVYNDDEMITAIKYRFVQSPDLDVEYVPEKFSIISLGLSGITDKDGNEVDALFWGGSWWVDDGTKKVYESREWKLDSPVKPGPGFSVPVGVTIYPAINNTWNDWLGAAQAELDGSYIQYGWNFSYDDAPSSQMSLLDENGDVIGNISETLSQDEIFAVQREEVSVESQADDAVTASVASSDAELVGCFNQLNIEESGTYAVSITLPDKLYDEIEGAASSDLVVYAITDSYTGGDGTGEDSGDIFMSSLKSFRVRAADDNSLPESGRLLASDGRTFDKVGAKDLVLTASLKAAADENFTNYRLYLGLKKTEPQTPEEIEGDIACEDENTNKRTSYEDYDPYAEQSTPPAPVVEPPADNTSADNAPVVEPPADNTSADNTPSSDEPSTINDQIREIVMNDESQNVDGGTKSRIEALIGSGQYEMMTLLEAAQAGLITEYNGQDVSPNERLLQAVFELFSNAKLSCILPAFTLNTDKPVILTLKVSADSANNLPLHLFKMKGSQVGGSSLKFVKFSSAPDTSEDEDAIFTDGTKKITELSSRTVYVTSVFESGSYAPLVITGTESSETDKYAPDAPISASGSGCNAGLFGLGAFMLLAFRLIEKPR